MKRVDLLRKIRKAAREHGVEFSEVRDTGPHTIFRCGGLVFPIPRHNEINEHTARGLLRDLEDTFGKGWWR